MRENVAFSECNNGSFLHGAQANDVYSQVADEICRQLLNKPVKEKPSVPEKTERPGARKDWKKNRSLEIPTSPFNAMAEGVHITKKMLPALFLGGKKLAGKSAQLAEKGVQSTKEHIAHEAALKAFIETSLRRNFPPNVSQATWNVITEATIDKLRDLEVITHGMGIISKPNLREAKEKRAEGNALDSLYKDLLNHHLSLAEDVAIGYTLETMFDAINRRNGHKVVSNVRNTGYRTNLSTSKEGMLAKEQYRKALAKIALQMEIRNFTETERIASMLFEYQQDPHSGELKLVWQVGKRSTYPSSIPGLDDSFAASSDARLTKPRTRAHSRTTKIHRDEDTPPIPGLDDSFVGDSDTELSETESTFLSDESTFGSSASLLQGSSRRLQDSNRMEHQTDRYTSPNVEEKVGKARYSERGNLALQEAIKQITQVSQRHYNRHNPAVTAGRVLAKGVTAGKAPLDVGFGSKKFRALTAEDIDKTGLGVKENIYTSINDAANAILRILKGKGQQSGRQIFGRHGVDIIGDAGIIESQRTRVENTEFKAEKKKSWVADTDNSIKKLENIKLLLKDFYWQMNITEKEQWLINSNEEFLSKVATWIGSDSRMSSDGYNRNIIKLMKSDQEIQNILYETVGGLAEDNCNRDRDYLIEAGKDILGRRLPPEQSKRTEPDTAGLSGYELFMELQKETKTDEEYNRLFQDCYRNGPKTPPTGVRTFW